LISYEPFRDKKHKTPSQHLIFPNFKDKKSEEFEAKIGKKKANTL